MIYLIYGIEPFLIDEEVKKIINKVNDINISRYDMDIDNINTVIDDAQVMSLFDSEKTIIVNNSNIFTAQKNLIEHDLKEFEKYIESPNPNSTIIFIADSEKLDTRKKINKLMNKYGKVIQCQVPSNLTQFVKNRLSDYNITTMNINLIIERVGNNLGILNQELIKLKNYKMDNLDIEEVDILSVISENIQPDLFLFIDTLVNKNIEQALILYREMMIFNEEPIKIITMLATNFRIMYQSKLLSLRGYSQVDIASTLGIHPYRVKLALEKGRGYSEEVLITYLDKLSDLDIAIKSGKIDKELGLELFIINM